MSKMPNPPRKVTTLHSRYIQHCNLFIHSFSRHNMARLQGYTKNEKKTYSCARVRACAIYIYKFTCNVVTLYYNRLKIKANKGCTPECNLCVTL